MDNGPLPRVAGHDAVRQPQALIVSTKTLFVKAGWVFTPVAIRRAAFRGDGLAHPMRRRSKER
eukprot:4637926-Pyramimonas_sp.AAC.1